MGRKDKKVPTERQEACHKLNFLHQVRKIIVSRVSDDVYVSVSINEIFMFSSPMTQASHAVLAINPENVEMSRFYASTMKEIAKKLVYKL